KWTVATFCLVAAVFGCVAENVIQNTLTNYERIFYATLVILKIIVISILCKHWEFFNTRL
ncbi:hypothetical protein, partial [Brevibacillus agri]|uniref:hypothetical protein n=1 Tax=Brevibacillus agri TaxID=51101 RepID=UPI001C83AD30